MGSGNSIKILAIPGSLRRHSYNLALLKTAQDVAPAGVEVEIFTLHDIPFFNADVEAAGLPEAVQQLIEAVRQADGLLFASPQYNRGITGVLKNTIDWLSREPAGRPLIDKPVAIVGATISQSATAASRAMLVDLLDLCKCVVMREPQIGLVESQNHISDGTVVSNEVRDEIRSLLKAFTEFIEEPAETQAAD